MIPNHEYGAVMRIWDRVCAAKGARRVSVSIPEPLTDPQQILDTLVSSINPQTKLLVISHITSATALIMPVAEICAAFQEQGVSVCVDGPHAPAHLPFKIDELGCAFYAASCHKWLCAPLGSGFLYVNPYFQNQIEPPIKSWGRLLPALPERWDEEFTWTGTRDPSPFLAVPTAIEFMNHVGLDEFRGRCFWLAESMPKNDWLNPWALALSQAGRLDSMERWPMSHFPRAIGQTCKKTCGTSIKSRSRSFISKTVGSFVSPATCTIRRPKLTCS